MNPLWTLSQRALSNLLCFHLCELAWRRMDFGYNSPRKEGTWNQFWMHQSQVQVRRESEKHHCSGIFIYETIEHLIPASQKRSIYSIYCFVLEHKERLASLRPLLRRRDANCTLCSYSIRDQFTVFSLSIRGEQMTSLKPSCIHRRR